MRTTDRVRRVLLTVPIVLFSAVAIAALFLVAYPRVDAAICYRRLGAELGVEPSWDGIATYIRSTLPSGTSREEVHTRLLLLGRLEVSSASYSQTPLSAGGEKIYVRMCGFHWNDMWVTVTYDREWTVLETDVWSDEP